MLGRVGVVLTWTADALYQTANAIDAIAVTLLDRTHEPPAPHAPSPVG
jgi:hypothetical protein